MRAWWLTLALAAGQAPVVQTQVTTFQPAAPPASAPVQHGRCFTNSIAVDRAGVFRCMAGNAIADPCFATGAPDAVVCRANPATGEPGFVLRVSEPLPAEVKHGPPAPWLIELENGAVCEISTGSLPPVDGDPARWTCAPARSGGAASYLSSLVPGKVWHAQQFVLLPSKRSGTGYVRGQPQTVAIRRIWQ